MMTKNQKVKLLVLLQNGEISVPEFRSLVSANGDNPAAEAVDKAYLAIELTNGFLVNGNQVSNETFEEIKQKAELIVFIPGNGRDYL